jgi:hypothetical protein
MGWLASLPFFVCSPLSSMVGVSPSSWKFSGVRQASSPARYPEYAATAYRTARLSAVSFRRTVPFALVLAMMACNSAMSSGRRMCRRSRSALPFCTVANGFRSMRLFSTIQLQNCETA